MTFTKEDVLASLRKLDPSKINPRFVSEWDDDGKVVWVPASKTTRLESSSCRYADPADLTKPSCAIGNVFFDLGGAEALAKVALSGDQAEHAALKTGLDFTEAARMFMYAVQTEADMGRAWGEAIEEGIAVGDREAREVAETIAMQEEGD